MAMSTAGPDFHSWGFWDRTPLAAFHKLQVRRTAFSTVVVMSAAILLVGLFYVWTRMQIVQIGYEVSSLEDKNKDLKNRKRELIVEIASLQSPGELDEKAAKLGLIIPPVNKVVNVP
jgi:cell division protein FtsL